MKVRSILFAVLALSLVAAPAAAQSSAQARFAAIMDEVFGPGAWRMTGGYRTPQRENQLRAQGAMTVGPGRLSRHSMGSHDAPGAYDLVVDGVSPYEAAARLRRAGAPFARYQPKGAHGTQGPHLHLEPYSLDLKATGPVGWPSFIQASYSAPRRSRTSFDAGLPVVTEGVRRAPRAVEAVEVAPIDVASAEPVSPLVGLRAQALRDDPEAQLRLGHAYARGEDAPQNLSEAMTWMALAAGNEKATAEVRDEARAAVTRLSRRREADREAEVIRFAQAQRPDPRRTRPQASGPQGANQRGLVVVLP